MAEEQGESYDFDKRTGTIEKEEQKGKAAKKAQSGEPEDWREKQ